MIPLSQLQLEQYNEFWKYIPTSLSTPVSSVFDTLVLSLSNEQANFLSIWYQFKDNINVLTSDTNGVTAWEAFLQLPNRPDLSLQARRGRLYSRMVTQPSTIGTLKSVVKSYIGTDNFQFNEYYTYNDPVSAFYYEVQINESFTASFIRSDLEDDLQRLQPEHCRLVRILDPFYYLSDTVSPSDSIITQVINVFRADISPCDDPDYIVV